MYPHLYIVPTLIVILSGPSDELYEGASLNLTCTASLPEIVDTSVTVVTFRWMQHATNNRVNVYTTSLTSTLTISHLVLTDAGQYYCEATAHSLSQYILASSPGRSTIQSITIRGKY